MGQYRRETMRLIGKLMIGFIISIGLIQPITFKVQAQDDKVKIGLYETSPYYDIDESGNIKGYYHDLLLLIQEVLPFSYEYVITDFSDGLQQLKEGQIDLMFGISLVSDRLNEMNYSQRSIGEEVFGLYTNPLSGMTSIEHLNGKTIGLIEGSHSTQTILNLFSVMGISVEPYLVQSWKELEQSFESGKVDVIPHYSELDRPGYDKIYEMTGDQVFIVTSNEQKSLIYQLDDALATLYTREDHPIEHLYASYFSETEEVNAQVLRCLAAWLLVLLLLVSPFLIVIWKRFKIKQKIRLNMKKERYLLQYQPIVHLNSEKIRGFEGLLRLYNDQKQLIPPFQFIPEIEENGMLLEISLWILKKAIQDYDEIQAYDCVKNHEFYISINVSLSEIENRRFIRQAQKILQQSNLGPNKICLEIIERIKVNQMPRVAKHLALLKQAGFKIAMDDFGAEYSNLDLLLSLDTNIIKVDKFLIEGIEEDPVKNEMIEFIFRVSQIKNKMVVLEGVETKTQIQAIQQYHYDFIHVQGYYYYKPLFKQEIKLIDI